mgnify:FL=1|jgi:hypothetical protein|tara:strand:- start:1172 stop:1390 length:219 start_codon:yes stop_codon:yes gene_type:complete
MRKATYDGITYEYQDCTLCPGIIDLKIDKESGEVIWADGHNAWPLSEGRCCSMCNELRVIPARIVEMYRRDR